MAKFMVVTDVMPVEIEAAVASVVRPAADGNPISHRVEFILDGRVVGSFLEQRILGWGKVSSSADDLEECRMNWNCLVGGYKSVKNDNDALRKKLNAAEGLAEAIKGILSAGLYQKARAEAEDVADAALAAWQEVNDGL